MDQFPGVSSQPILIGGIVDSAVRVVMGGVVDAFNFTINLILDMSILNLAGQGMATKYAAMAQIGLYVLVPFVFIAIITGIVRGSLFEVLRVLLMGIGIAVLGVPATTFAVMLLQMIDHNITNTVLGVTGPQAQLFVERFAAGPPTDSAILARLVIIGVGIFLIFGLIIFYAEMLLRDVMILLITLFMPLALAAGVWRPTRAMLVRLIETLIVVIFSRSIAVSVLYIGMAISSEALSLADNSSSFGEGSQGLTLMLVGALTVMIASMQLPLLLTFFAGQGAYSSVGARQEYEQSPFALSSGRVDARDNASKAIKGGSSVALKALNKSRGKL